MIAAYWVKMIHKSPTSKMYPQLIKKIVIISISITFYCAFGIFTYNNLMSKGEECVLKNFKEDFGNCAFVSYLMDAFLFSNIGTSISILQLKKANPQMVRAVISL